MSASDKPGRRSPSAAAVALGLWVATYVAARFALESASITGWTRIALALVPLPFFLTTLVTLVRASRDLDELERRIQLEALAVAFPLSLVLFMTLGLIEVAQPLDEHNWSYRHTWPFLMLFYTIGLAIARKRYQ